MIKGFCSSSFSSSMEGKNKIKNIEHHPVKGILRPFTLFYNSFFSPAFLIPPKWPLYHRFTEEQTFNYKAQRPSLLNFFFFLPSQGVFIYKMKNNPSSTLFTQQHNKQSSWSYMLCTLKPLLFFVSIQAPFYSPSTASFNVVSRCLVN